LWKPRWLHSLLVNSVRPRMWLLLWRPTRPPQTRAAMLLLLWSPTQPLEFAVTLPLRLVCRPLLCRPGRSRRLPRLLVPSGCRLTALLSLALPAFGTRTLGGRMTAR
jgi:hypothetical protein